MSEGSAGEVSVEVNGRPMSIEAGQTLAHVLAALGIDAQSGGVAVAVDATVVPRSRWSQHRLEAGARIEVIRAVQGG